MCRMIISILQMVQLCVGVVVCHLLLHVKLILPGYQDTIVASHNPELYLLLAICLSDSYY